MNTTTTQERRSSLRIPTRAQAYIEAIDRRGRVLMALDDVKVLNVSAGGLALLSRVGVSEAMQLRIHPSGDEAAFDVRVLSNLPAPEYPDRFILRCKLTVGEIPVSMM